MPLSVVCAPAGFGKTTALVSCLETLQQPVAWLSLDDADNAPRRFVEYIVAALQTVSPGLGGAVLQALKASNPPKPLGLLPGLMNELWQYPEPFVLVLDDYHLIHNEEVHRLLNFLLEHRPPAMHLAITSRCMPPLPLSRLRVRGLLVELTEADLRFTADEAQQFFHRSAGLDLGADEVAVLEQKTEGWVAGLQLAALSLRGEKDRQAFINDFAGDDRYIADYLTEEVLRQQSATVRQFLLQTSVLERLSGPLCNAVAGVENSAELLRQLEQSDMFLVPLDNRRCWYRYHHLFADLLQHQLAQSGKQEITALHMRASKWFAENGFPEEAMYHAGESQDHHQMVQVLEQYAQQLFHGGQCLLLSQWYEKVPLKYLRRNLLLLLLYAWNQYVGNGVIDDRLIQEIEQIAEQDASSITPQEQVTISLDLQLMRGFRALQRLDLPDAIAIGESLVEAMREQSVKDMAAPHLQLGTAYYVNGQLDKAFDTFKKSERDALHTKTLLCLNGASGGAAMARKRQGRLADAEALIQSALTRLKENNWEQRLFDTSWLYVALGNLAYERNDLQQAGIYLDQAADFAKLDRWDTIAAMVEVRRARICFARGDKRGLARSVKCYDSYKTGSVLLPLFPEPEYERMALALLQDDSELPGQWLAQRGIVLEKEIAVGQEAEYCLLAKYLLATQRPAEAALLLDRLQTIFRQQGRNGELIELLALQAVAYQAQGHDRQATEYLAQALGLAKAERYVRTFIDLGKSVADLLNPLRQGEHREYVASLLNQIAGHAEAPPAGLADVLSKKELKTLLLLAQGLSNNDIAKQSFVSVNTVKTHLKNIYAKLQVDNRIQAVERVRGAATWLPPREADAPLPQHLRQDH